MPNTAPFDAQVFNGGTVTGAAGDLVTGALVDQMLAAGGVVPTAAQATVLPQLITAASRLVRKFCRRYFVRQTYDGLYTIDQPGATLLLRQFPVNSVALLCTNPTAVLSIANTATSTNQRATVQLATTGVFDVPDLPPAVSGLTLTRVASGVSTAVSVPFSTNLTVQAVADAVNALGNGWTATVASGYALWPSADLRALQGTLPALGDNQASLVIHVDDLPFVMDNPAVAELEITDQAVDPFSSIRFGPYLSTSLDDLSVYGGRGGVRAVYDAGWDAIPEDVQQATVEIVADMLNVLKLNPRSAGETMGAVSWRLADFAASYHIPRWALGKLAPYVNHRA